MQVDEVELRRQHMRFFCHHLFVVPDQAISITIASIMSCYSEEESLYSSTERLSFIVRPRVQFRRRHPGRQFAHETKFPRVGEKFFLAHECVTHRDEIVKRVRARPRGRSFTNEGLKEAENVEKPGGFQRVGGSFEASVQINDKVCYVRPGSVRCRVCQNCI